VKARLESESPCSCRLGLTLLEVVLVLVLILIGVAVFLVFVQRTREAAKQAECANHLKILGEAIYYFEGTPENLREVGLSPRAGGPDAKQFLPAARIAEGYATWAVQIAPYLSASDPLAAWDVRKSYFDQPDDARQKIVPEFYCPARVRQSLLSESGDGRPGQADNLPGAVGDYACVSGDGDPAHLWTTDKANGPLILGEVLERKGDLILRWRSRTSLASLERGLSYTLLLGDKHVPVGEYGQAAVGDGSLYNGQNPASFSRIGGPGYGLSPSPEALFNTNFGSWHPGCCQFLRADLSVHAVANSINENVLGDLMIRGPKRR